MEKRRLSRIMSRAERCALDMFAEEIKKENEVVIIKKPETGLAMIKMREPVKESLFYMGEVMVTEAVMEINGSKGIAVVMGDDFARAMDMAIIDAACNAGVFGRLEELEQMEREQVEREEKENAMFRKTMVDFHSMDSEVTG